MRSIFLLFLLVTIGNSPLCQAMDLIDTGIEAMPTTGPTQPFNFQSAIKEFANMPIGELSEPNVMSSKLDKALWIIWAFGKQHPQHLTREHDVKEFIEHVLTADPSPLVNAIRDCMHYINDQFQNVSCNTLKDIDNLDRGYPKLHGLAFLIKKIMVNKIRENIARMEFKTREPILWCDIHETANVAAVIESNGSITAWDLLTKQTVFEHTAIHEKTIDIRGFIKLSTDGSQIAVVSCEPDQGTSCIAIWNLTQPSELIHKTKISQCIGGILGLEKNNKQTTIHMFQPLDNKIITYAIISNEEPICSSVKINLNLSSNCLHCTNVGTDIENVYFDQNSLKLQWRSIDHILCPIAISNTKNPKNLEQLFQSSQYRNLKPHHKSLVDIQQRQALANSNNKYGPYYRTC